MEKFYRICCSVLLCCLVRSMYAGASSVCGYGPELFKRYQTGKLECDFEGWPPARTVYWYKDHKPIINGTDGLYQVEDQLSDVKLRSTLYFSPVHMEHEGLYTCKANNSHNSRCPAGLTIQVIVVCPYYITATPNNVTAIQFHNTSLKCSALSWDDCWDEPILTWHYRNRTLQNTSKYTVRGHTNSECKGRQLQAEIILDIANVTDEDDDMYFCQMSCDDLEAKDVIELVTVLQPGKEGATLDTTVTSQSPILEDATLSLKSTGRLGEWIVVVVGVGVSVCAILLGVVCALTKRKFARNRSNEYHSGKGITSNKVFISYSSNDFAWVAEYLISLLEKHSISYSIHTRDFELGRPFVQNMADSVYGSRQVLIVLSDNYLASNFCREELRMAVQRGIYSGDSSLVLVLIDTLKQRRLPFTLRNKNLLDFDKLAKKDDWEKKLIGKILGEKTVTL